MMSCPPDDGQQEALESLPHGSAPPKEAGRGGVGVCTVSAGAGAPGLPRSEVRPEAQVFGLPVQGARSRTSHSALIWVSSFSPKRNFTFWGCPHLLLLYNFLKNIRYLSHRLTCWFGCRPGPWPAVTGSRPVAQPRGLYIPHVRIYSPSTCVPSGCLTSVHGLEPSQHPYLWTKDTEVPRNVTWGQQM